MFQARTYKNEFAKELNDVYDYGAYFEAIRLQQFVSTIDIKINEDNEKIISDLAGEDPDVKTSILSQIDVSNSLFSFHDMLFKSLLITTYSLLENRLKEICNICANHNALPKYSTLRKNKYSSFTDLSAPKEYFIDELKIDFHEIEDLWNGLKKYTIVRKSIIHYNCEIDPSEFLKYFESDKNIIIEDDGHIEILDKIFVIKFVKDSVNLLQSLIELINKKFELVKID